MFTLVQTFQACLTMSPWRRKPDPPWIPEADIQNTYTDSHDSWYFGILIVINISSSNKDENQNFAFPGFVFEISIVIMIWKLRSCQGHQSSHETSSWCEFYEKSNLDDKNPITTMIMKIHDCNKRVFHKVNLKVMHDWFFGRSWMIQYGFYWLMLYLFLGISTIPYVERSS